MAQKRIRLEYEISAGMEEDMKSTWKKVMSALLVLAMLAGVLAVPGQKAEAKINMKKIQILGHTKTIEKGKTVDFILNLPGEAKSNKVKWSLSNTKVAKITSSFDLTKNKIEPSLEPSVHVKGIKAGKTTLLCKLDGKTYKYNITIINRLPKLNKGKLNITKGKTATLKVKNTSKKVSWKILSGKKNISLKKKGKTAAVIRGKKKGSAKVQAKVAGQTLICKVTVKAVSKPASQPSETPGQTPTKTPSQIPVFNEEEWKGKEPGLYDSETKILKKSWDTLIDEGFFTISEHERLMPGAYTQKKLVDQGIEKFNKDLSGVLVIQDGVKCIGGKAGNANCALSYSALTGVVIPNSVINIGYGAFSACTSLTGVAIPNSVTTIDYQAFTACTSLTGVTIPNSVTFIGKSAFYGCSMTSVTIPNSVTFIDSDVFSYCEKLATVIFKGNQADIAIEPDAFSNTPWGASHPITAPAVPGNHDSDVAALKKIIAEQKAKGACVSEDINDSNEYTWNEEGRLTGISWNGRELSGSISFSELPNLLRIECGTGANINVGGENNYLTALDVSGCRLLKSLECSRQHFTMLDLSNNIYLENFSCIYNRLTELDLSNNKKLSYIQLRGNNLSLKVENLILPDNRILEDLL